MYSGFGVRPFTPVPPVAPAPPTTVPLPLEVRVGDDWPFVFTISDASGQPIDLTGMEIANPISGGATVGAELFGSFLGNPAVIGGQNGSLQIVDAVNGVVSGVVSRTLTNYVVPQQPGSTSYPVRLSVFIIDTLWRKHTFPPIVLLPLRASDLACVPTVPAQITLIAGAQGPAGPSSSLTADQIAALVNQAQTTAEAYTDQQIAALPPPGISASAAQSLIQQDLAGYATQTSVGQQVSASATQIEQAVPGIVVQTLDTRNLPDNRTDLIALIQSLISEAMSHAVALNGSVPASAQASGTPSQVSQASGSAPSSASVTGTASNADQISGTAPSSASVTGSATTTSPTANPSGTVPSSASVTGATSNADQVSGAAPASASVAGAASASEAAQGSVPPSASVGGATSTGGQAYGQVPSSAAASGTATASQQPQGGVPASAATTGTASGSQPASGSAPSSASTTATPSATDNLSGGVPSSAAASGAATASPRQASRYFAFPGLLITSA